MKKEVFLAVFVGFALGLVITFGIWTANKSLNSEVSQPSPTPPPAGESTPTPPPSDSRISLALTSPEDESIASSNTIQVTGKTLPGIPVIVVWENSQTIILADTSGDFDTEIRLEGGYNRITVTAYDIQGNSASKDLLVTYTTSKI